MKEHYVQVMPKSSIGKPLGYSIQRWEKLMLYTGTCKMHEINPYAWRKDILRKIATHPINKIEQLLPHHWNEHL